MKKIYNFKTYLIPFVLVYGLLVGGYSYAEIVVVVHPSNKANISKKNIQRIFLGKMKEYPGGGTATPIYLPAENPVADQFNVKVLKKNIFQLRAYWGQYVFTGKGMPPKQVDSMQQVMSLVSSNEDAIGYIDSGSVNSSVKVIHKH